MNEIVTPWSSIGYLTYKRTYARDISDTQTEEFNDTIERVIQACRDQLQVGFTEDEEERLKEYSLKLKGSVAGRFLWQLGTETIDRFGLASLQNCAFISVDDPITPFCWTMDMLALGAGVGFNIQRKHVDKIGNVRDWFEPPTRFDEGGADFIVPDSREGWVKLLGKTLKAAFLSDSEKKGTFTYSTQVIRGKGEPIKGFGGVASGPNSLVKGINQISEVLCKRRGKRFRPIDALDILNIIASIIVAGNVRRSASLAIGDCDDVEYLLAKRWDLGNIPSWRAMSNNAVACDDINDLHEYFWDGYEGRGEPYGLINLNLARSCGRLGEEQYKDPLIEGYNPCGEQGLESGETCCLGEIFLPNIEFKEELFDVAELLYRVCKHSLMLPCHQENTEKVVQKNYRIGLSCSGLKQASEEQLSWLSDCYEYLRIFDTQYSNKLGIPVSIKLTTVKPSGTLSLLPGVTPGIHPGFARYMYRRIRIAADHPLVNICESKGYPIEYVQKFDGSPDRTTRIITFPFCYPEGTTLAKDMTAIDQLKFIIKIQTRWSDNAISCTVYYDKEELPGIKQFLKMNYKHKLKTVSFLLKTEHGFNQMPYEEISKETYDKFIASVEPLTNLTDHLDLDETDTDCVLGVCPVR